MGNRSGKNLQGTGGVRTAVAAKDSVAQWWHVAQQPD